MRTTTLFILVLTIGMAFSCATGKKALQKGNYSDAVIKSIERLRSNPESKNARATLENAYPLAVRTLTTEIDELLAGQVTGKYEMVAEKYRLLQRMAEEIRRSPAALKIIPNPQSFSSQLAGARDKATAEAYDLGMTNLQLGDREGALQAIQYFQQVLEYNPDYKNTRKMLDRARDIATIRVVVEPIAVPARYKFNADFFRNEMVSFLNKQNEYVVFFTPQEAERFGSMDEVLEMEFIDFQIGSTKEKQSEKEVTSRDSVKVGTATINGRSVNVMNKVKAKFTTHQRAVSSNGILQVRIIDVNSKKVINRRQFPGTYVWETEWASYNGDERALTAEQMKLCKAKPQSPPNAQDLFYEFTRPIFDQTKNYLRGIYRNY